MSEYLLKRGDIYHFRMVLPSDVAPSLSTCLGVKSGKVQFSLRTSDRRAAQHEARGYANQWQNRINEARTGVTQKGLAGMAKLGRDLRSWEAQARHEMPANAPEQVRVIQAQVQRIKASQPATLSEAFTQAYEGNTLSIGKHVEVFINQEQITAKTKHQRRASIMLLAGRFEHWSAVTPKALDDWLPNLIGNSGKLLSRATKLRVLSDWRTYWNYLKRKEHLAATMPCPLDSVKLPKDERKSQDAESSEDCDVDNDEVRVPFELSEIQLIVQAAMARGDQSHADLITLAAHTGARIEELCQLRGRDVRIEEGVSYFDIRKGKTKAAKRKIPVHLALTELVARLIGDDPQNFLIREASEKTKYGNRADLHSKRFARLRDRLGFPSSKVFHSIRKTVATQLERAGVPEGIAAELLGHKKQTMTYGLYSGGMDIKQKAEAVAKLPNLIADHEP